MYDNSTLCSYSICPFKYYLQYIKGLARIDNDETTVRFKFGSAVHKYLEQLYKNEPIDMDKCWSNYEEVIGETVLTKANGIRLCEMYKENWAEENKSFKVIDVENKVQFKVGEFDFVVKMDTVVEKQGCTFGLEHKAQPLDCNILTNDGWVKMKDIKVGDKIIGRNGKETKVIGVFPQGELDCYKIIFRDRSFTKCSGDHLWTVINQYANKKEQTLTTLKIKELMSKTIGKKKLKNGFKIPIIKPVEFKNHKDVTIDPYLLGALIGNGYLSGKTVQISIGNQDVEQMIEMLSKLLPDDISINKSKGGNYSWIIKSKNGNKGKNLILNSLRELNLSGKKSYEKFIPKSYLFSSIENRIALLQGLMDTDGNCYKGYLTYATSSEQLAIDVVHLVRSLGFTARYRKGTWCVSNRHQRYVVNIKTEGIIPFRLKRKIKSLRALTFSPSRYIDSIEKCEPSIMQCIQVEASDGLYVTDDFIVTHNTTQKNPQYAMKNYDIASQITAQTYATKLVHGECSGIIVDIMTPKVVTKPELIIPEHESVKLYSNVEVKHSKYYGCEMAYCSGFTTLFARNVFNRFDEQIEGWKLNTLKQIEKIEHDKQSNYFVKHDNGYMCGMCQYKELCIMSVGMELDESILELSYCEVNPYEYLED